MSQRGAASTPTRRRTWLRPTYCVNAESCAGVPLADYDFVLADPPYIESDAERYRPIMVNRNKVVATLAAGLPSGAYVCWLDQVYPIVKQGRAEARGGDRQRRQHESPVPRVDGVPPRLTAFSAAGTVSAVVSLLWGCRLATVNFRGAKPQRPSISRKLRERLPKSANGRATFQRSADCCFCAVSAPCIFRGGNGMVSLPSFFKCITFVPPCKNDAASIHNPPLVSDYEPSLHLVVFD